MTEGSSENRYNISCDECGHNVSDEFVKKNQDQNKPLYCELCGAQINLKPSKKEEVSKRKRKGEIITQHENKEVKLSYTTEELRQEIKNYVYQKTYELLKTTPFVIRRLKQQKDLRHSQKIKLAKKLRKILLSTSLPVHGLEQLTRISQKKIKNYFDNFKSSLKTKQKFQPKIHPRIIENIEFGFRLINGDFEPSTLSKDNQKAIKNLLHAKGFKINIKTKNSFSYQLSLFLCRQIYKKVTIQGQALELLPNKNQLTKSYILKTAKEMIALILNDLLKKRFSRNYRILKQNLELDWVYRESLINHICSLVKFMYKLTYNAGDKSKLNGFERLITDDLKRSKFFENDECLTPEFKLNLTLILSRIIYKIIESNSNLNSQEQRPKRFNILNKNNNSNLILEEILAGNEIKPEFLKKFYKLSIEEFQKEYDKFQAKMKIDIIYKENFRIYLSQLIKIVNKITQRRSKKSKHPKIELAVITDLSNYNFIWDNNQIDPRDCFIKNEKKSLDLDTNNQSINLPISPISISNLEKKLINQIKSLIKLINCSKEQKKLIWINAQDILKEFISRVNNNEIRITKKANYKVITCAIIFTVVSSNNDMPKFNIAKLSGLSARSISQYYSRYFKEIYPKQASQITSHYGFANIRNIISIYLFNMLDSKKTDVKEMIFQLKNNINNKRSLPNKLTRKDIKLLSDLIKNQPEKFDKFFSDLTEIIKHLYSLSIVHKRIGARINIKYIAENLNKKNINLSQDFTYFYDSLINIFHVLKRKFPYIFSTSSYSRAGLPDKEGFEKENEYRRIVGSRIKIYILKKLYNGIYFRKSLGKCPECEQEGLKLNTDITKLKALEFHHTRKGKKHFYSARRLFRMFMNDRSNPNFLDDLIKKIETEKVVLLCGNHHDIRNYKNFNYFKHLIAWINIPNDLPQDIFSLSPELIHTLIRISVDNHPKTKNLSIRQKDNIRAELTRLLKKRYIIETFYGEKCHICMEFNTKDHLTAFQFSHIDKNNKSNKASKLSKYLSCSEMIEILGEERGGFVCSNCHTVLDSEKYLPLLNKIYDDENIIKKVREHYNFAKKRFKPINYNEISIKNPLKKSLKISDSILTYLIAIDYLSKSNQAVTDNLLVDYLGFTSRSAPRRFFKRNSGIMNQFVKIRKCNQGLTYELTKNGIMAVSLINHFKSYYKSL